MAEPPGWLRPEPGPGVHQPRRFLGRLNAVTGRAFGIVLDQDAEQVDVQRLGHVNRGQQPLALLPMEGSDTLAWGLGLNLS